jgi:hypothetical protein
LPEYFEDNMRIWMDNFYILLEVENPLLKTGVKYNIVCRILTFS